MPSNTPNLGLKKINTATDGNNTFNIDTDLNDNWDKIDLKVKEIEDATAGITVPVTKVNNKTGDVVLSASDIKAADGKTVETHLADYTKQTPYAGITTGAANNYVINTPAITTLTTGMSVCVQIHVANNPSINSTLNWNGKGAKNIFSPRSSSVVSLNTGGIYTLRYNGSVFFIQGADDTATETVTGVVELATTAEVTAGTDTTRVVTPKGLKDQGYFNQGNYGKVLSVGAITLSLTNANSVMPIMGNVTIPASTTVAFPIGTQITFINQGGTTTFTPSSGVTLSSKDSKRTIDGLYASATLVLGGTNTWFLIGALK